MPPLLVSWSTVMRRPIRQLVSSLTTFLVIFATGGVLQAANTNLPVTATVITKNVCKFRSSSFIDFGNLDPSNPVNVTKSTTITFRCQGSTPLAAYVMSDDDGLHESGPNANRMQHTTVPTEYLPYSLSLSPNSGLAPKLVDQTLTVTGTVLGLDYQNAYLGSYSDTVVITLTP